jgi:nucleoside-diphosphate-sugar epimerase
MKDPSSILVTGASGFIGRHVVAALAEAGYTVRAAVRRPPQPPFGHGIEVSQHPDLSEPFDWRPLLSGVTRVVHLAGIAQTGRGIAAKCYDRINRLATKELAGAAAKAGVAHFVFVSSIRAQSGPAADHALTESDTPAPTDAYGRSKLAAEAEVRSAGVPFTILRPALLYGAGLKGNFALLMGAARSPLPLPLRSFSNRRSLLSIDNFLSALAFVLSTPAAKGETYIVADPGMPLRLADVIAILRQAQGRRPLLLPLPLHHLEDWLRLLRQDRLWDRLGSNLRADAGKLIAAGWRPIDETRGGLAALVQTEMRLRKMMPPMTPTPRT